MPNLEKLQKSASNKDVIEIYCDGTGIPAIESCYCILVAKKNAYDRKSIYIENRVFEKQLNAYQIEKLALIRALEIANMFKNTINIHILTDRLDLVEEIYTYKSKTSKFYNSIKNLLLQNISISWINRDSNLAGKYLEKRNIKLQHYRSPYKFKRILNNEKAIN